MTDHAAIDLKAYRYHEGVMRAAHKDNGNSYAGLAAGFIHNLIAEVEALREREGELVGALEPFASGGWVTNASDVRKARIALAASPSAALERARAKDEVVRLARFYLEGWTAAPIELPKAFARLDVLDRPAKESTP